jgi:hypothetical protein
VRRFGHALSPAAIPAGPGADGRATATSRAGRCTNLLLATHMTNLGTPAAVPQTPARRAGAERPADSLLLIQPLAERSVTA